jgi:hypothetical protein
LTALIAYRWLRLPPSTARPESWHTPRLVPTIAFSRSCAAKALPDSNTSTQPSRTRRASGTSPPEWTTAGPATITIFSPAARVLRISRALPAIAMPLLTSAEISFDMKPKTE